MIKGEKARYRLQYGAKLLKKDGSKVKAGEILAEWDPILYLLLQKKKVRTLCGSC